MRELRDRYRVEHQGNDRAAMAAMVFDLMAGDEARFKAGYSEDNAVLAVAEVFDVDVDTVTQAVKFARKYEAGVDR